MAMQMARARALAQQQMQATLGARKTRRQVKAQPIQAGLLEDVTGITRFIQEIGVLGGDPRGQEIEPWQPLGGRKGVPKGLKEYDNVYVEGGRVWAPYRDGTRRMLGYTPTAAKKKFKTKRRRKRLTKRDMYILSVVEKTGNTSLIHML
jgi:hypothetical protein